MEKPRPVTSLSDFKRKREEKAKSEETPKAEIGDTQRTERDSGVMKFSFNSGGGYSVDDMFNRVSEQLKLGSMLEGLQGEKIKLIRELKASTIITNSSRATAQKALADYSHKDMIDLINSTDEFTIKKRPVFFIVALELLEAVR